MFSALRTRAAIVDNLAHANACQSDVCMCVFDKQDIRINTSEKSEFQRRGRMQFDLGHKRS